MALLSFSEMIHTQGNMKVNSDSSLLVKPRAIPLEPVLWLNTRFATPLFVCFRGQDSLCFFE